MRSLTFCLFAGALAIGAAAFGLLPVTAAPRPASERVAKTDAELLVFEGQRLYLLFHIPSRRRAELSSVAARTRRADALYRRAQSGHVTAAIARAADDAAHCRADAERPRS